MRQLVGARSHSVRLQSLSTHASLLVLTILGFACVARADQTVTVRSGNGIVGQPDTLVRNVYLQRRDLFARARTAPFAENVIDAPGEYIAGPTGVQAGQDRPAPPLPLAESDGAWVVETSRRGGLASIRTTVAISSTRDVQCSEEILQCHPEVYRSAADRIDSILAKEDLTTPWSDKRLLTCMDCPATTITIYRRQAKDVQTVTSYTWTALSRDDLPEAVKALRDTLESLASRK